MSLSFLERLGRAVHFGLRALLAAPLALRRPADLISQLYQIRIGALQLGAVAGMAVGVVVWLHLRTSLEHVAGRGALQYLPQALALAVVLEFAPLSAAFIVAGRTGATLGAELGSMRLTEQVDALEVLGLSPLRVLVAPRVLACTLALPLLTVFIDYLGVLSGFAAETVSSGTLSWTQYRSYVLQVLAPSDVVPATLKTLVFGYLIGVTGCYQGLHASGGTEGVGRAATRSVVLSIFLVLVSNVILVRIIQLT